MPAIAAWTSVGSNSASSVPRATSTRPNSPACASASPLRSAVPGVAPRRRDRPATIASFADQRHDEHHRDQPGLRRHDGEVELHADGDEEEAEQHLAERLDVLLDLVAVLRLGDQHAGDERAERERQTGDLGQVGRGERDEEHVDA